MDSIKDLKHAQFESIYKIRQRMKQWQEYGENRINKYVKELKLCIIHCVENNYGVAINERIVDLILSLSKHEVIFNSFKQEPILLFFMAQNMQSGRNLYNEIDEFERSVQSIINNFTYKIPAEMRFQLLLCYTNHSLIKNNTNAIYAIKDWTILKYGVYKNYILISQNMAINLEFNKCFNIETQQQITIHPKIILSGEYDFCSKIMHLMRHFDIHKDYGDINDMMHYFVDSHFKEFDYNYAEYFYFFLMDRMYETKYKFLVAGFCRSNNFMNRDLYKFILMFYPFFWGQPDTTWRK